MVEDFYDIEPAPSGEDQQANYFEEERESSLAIDHFAEDDPTTTSDPDITLRSMTCTPPEDANCSCNCDQSCRKGKTVISRRICLDNELTTKRPNPAKLHWPLNPDARPFQPQTTLKQEPDSVIGSEPKPASESEPIPGEPRSKIQGQKVEARKSKPEKQNQRIEDTESRPEKESGSENRGQKVKDRESRSTSHEQRVKA